MPAKLPRMSLPTELAAGALRTLGRVLSVTDQQTNVAPGRTCDQLLVALADSESGPGTPRRTLRDRNPKMPQARMTARLPQ